MRPCPIRFRDCVRRRGIAMLAHVNKWWVGLNGFASRNDESLWLLLLLSGLAGAVKGTLTATWQHPVETAQVLLGLVTYDHSSLPYAYHVSAFSIINYFACLFLALTNSEFLSSILIAALVGALSMQTLAMCAFLILGNTYRALLIAIVLGSLKLVGSGISYPIIFTGTEHTYGRIGLAFVIYAALWLALARYRTGLFLTGLSIGFHAAWGMWLNGCLALVFLLKYKKLSSLLTWKNFAYYLTGVLIPVTLLVWQKTHFPVSPQSSLAHAGDASDIFLNYIRYWDLHRHSVDDPTKLFNGFLFAGLSLYLSILYLVKNRSRDISAGETIFFWFMIVSTVLSIPLVFVPSWFDPSYFSQLFVQVMPGRFINISIFLCPTIFFASLYAFRAGMRSIPHVLITMLAIFLLVRGQYGDTQGIIFALVGFIWAAQYMRKASLDVPAAGTGERNPLGVFLIMLVCVSPAYLLYKEKDIKADFPRIDIPRPYSGAILTTYEYYMIQIQTRISTITPHIDGYLYLGNDAYLLDLNKFTTDLFGISLTSKPPSSMLLHHSVILTDDFKRTWESRSCTQWQDLAAQYYFGMILVPGTIHLKLEKINPEQQRNVYKPTCAIPSGASCGLKCRQLPEAPRLT